MLAKLKGETVMMMEDTIGITDTTGNMGVLGRFLCENGHEHAYCTDHKFYLNAKLVKRYAQAEGVLAGDSE